MKRIVLLVVALGSLLAPVLAAAETRTYTETVSVKIENDEAGALAQAKIRATEQALRHYLGDVYKDRASTPNLTGDAKFVQDLDVLESKVDGFFSKVLTAKINVTIDENEVRSYLKRQGAVTGKNDDRRVFVVLIPGKMDSGDAPVVLDILRAEIRKRLTAAEYTVIDSEELVKRLESLTEEADYNKLVGQLDGLGEWVVLGKVDLEVKQDGSTRAYHAMMTGKALSITSRDLLWEDNIDGSVRVKPSESPLSALRLAAIDGGKKFADAVLGSLNNKTLTQERRGSRFEVRFASGGDYKLERRILKVLKDDIKGLKDVNQKSRGKGDMVVDLTYVGKGGDLVDLLLDNFEKDPQLAKFSPEVEGNKVVFKQK